MIKTLFTTIGAGILAFGMITAEPPKPLSKSQPRVALATS